jgi:hypothetical protein
MSRRVGVVLGLSGLLALALLGGAARSPAASKGQPLPPPSLRPSSAWLSVTTGSSNVSNLAPAVWAITARSNLAALRPVQQLRQSPPPEPQRRLPLGDDGRTRRPRRNLQTS